MSLSKKDFSLIFLIAFFLVLTIFFVGCGNKRGSKLKDNTQISLKIGLPSGFDVTPKEIVNLFMQRNPDIKVVIDDAPWGDYGKRVQLQILSNDCPDIWFLESGVIMSYGALGVAENLKSFVLDKEQSGHYLMLEDTKDAEGNVWGIPHALQPTALAS